MTLSICLCPVCFSVVLTSLRSDDWNTVQAMDTAGIPYLTPQAGMFVWVDLRRLLKSVAPTDGWAAETTVTDALVKEWKVLLSPGSACHAREPGMFRACVAWMPREAIAEGARRIVKFYNACAER